MRMKWQGVPKDKQEIASAPKRSRKKLDMSIKKHTYIDQIIRDNTKQTFPRPGPSDHFMDEEAIKKFRRDHMDLFQRKSQSESKKTNLPKEGRNFYFSMQQKNGPKIPAPGYTNPDSKNEKPPEENKMTFKRY